MTWHQGYAWETGYIYGYHHQQSPEWLRLALLSRGIAAPAATTPRYLELGFGQGVSLAIHAAACPGTFHGIDFNPSQVSHLLALSDAAGLPLTVDEASFEEFAARDDLPAFDIITLHGVWSWVSHSARDAILTLARRNLKPGGIMHVSYLASPGYAPLTPARQMMREYANRAARGPIASRIDQSLDFIDRLGQAGARHLVEDPRLMGRLADMKRQNRNYLAHEYFHYHWRPYSFAEVSDAMSAAKLEFAASATPLDNLEALSTPPAARALLDELPDPALREMARDLLVDRHFRSDIFVKGVRRLTAGEHVDLVRQQRFVATAEAPVVPAKVKIGAGEATLSEAVYAPIVAALREEPARPVTVATLAAMPACAGSAEAQLWEALLVLASLQVIAPQGAGDHPVEPAQRLNRAIMRRARHAEEATYLAVPAIGGALAVDRIGQLLLLGRAEGAPDPARFAVDVLTAQGETVMHEGRAVDDRAQALDLMTERWRLFQADRLPTLIRLGAIN